MNHKQIVVRRIDLSERQSRMLSTGSSMLNLCISGNPAGSLPMGKYALLVGDSTSGKTLLSMTILAEAARDPQFAHHRLIYDNVEDGMMMDIARMFGNSLRDRIEPPGKDKDGEPIYSESVQEFYYHLDDALKMGPCVYVLDSMDGLTTESEEAHFEASRKRHKAGKEAKGSYGDGKAKANSAGLRKALGRLRDTGSILLVVAQTRDSLAQNPFAPKKTRSGGHALRFYATVEFWSSLAGQIKRTVRGKERKIGDRIKFQVKKNRITGRLGETIVSVFPDYGLDDIGSMVDWLLEEGRWKQLGRGRIKARGWKPEETTIDNVVTMAEKSPGKLRRLRRIVQEHWTKLEEELSIKRPRRYV